MGFFPVRFFPKTRALVEKASTGIVLNLDAHLEFSPGRCTAPSNPNFPNYKPYTK